MTTNNAVDSPLNGTTGTGNFVGSTSPTLVTPALGTPASGVLTNCTGLTASGVVANSGGGIPVQVVQGQFITTESHSSATPVNSSVAVTITPTASTSKILVRAVLYVAVTTTDEGFFQFVRGSTPIGIGTTAGSRTSVGGSVTSANNTSMVPIALEWLDSPATTSATTYTVQVWTSGANALWINQTISDTNTAVFPRAVSTITAMEIK